MIDHVLISHLIKSELKEDKENRERNFKNDLFMHDVVPNTNGIFFKLYGDQKEVLVDEEEIEWIAPESEQDVAIMLRELRKTGWGG